MRISRSYRGEQFSGNSNHDEGACYNAFSPDPLRKIRIFPSTFSLNCKWWRNIFELGVVVPWKERQKVNELLLVIRENLMVLHLDQYFYALAFSNFHFFSLDLSTSSSISLSVKFCQLIELLYLWWSLIIRKIMQRHWKKYEIEVPTWVLKIKLMKNVTL